MKPYNPGGHAAYQERVLALLRKYYPDAASSLPPSTWAIMGKFWYLDLSELDTILADRYSDFGPAPRLPSDMLRSILLSVEFKITSYTKWAADLKQNHLYAILSGFPVGDTPGTGTFYDFHSRLWISDKNNLSDPIHPQKKKLKKPGKMGKKLVLWKKLLLRTCLNSSSSFLLRIWLPAKCFTTFLKGFSLNTSYKPVWSIFLNFPWPGMALLSILPRGNAKNVPVTVW